MNRADITRTLAQAVERLVEQEDALLVDESEGKQQALPLEERVGGESSTGWLA